MKNFRNFFPLFFILLGIVPCTGSSRVRFYNIEVMRPGIVIFPDNAKVVAIFNRNRFRSDTCTFRYYNGKKNVTDHTFSYRDMSNTCVDALTKFLQKNGYFTQIVNNKDYLNSLIKPSGKIVKPEELIKIAHADICISLDLLVFSHNRFDSYNENLYSIANSSWSINVKNDSSTYVFNQADTLIYNNEQQSGIKFKDKNLKQFFEGAAEYEGQLFGKKIIPNWEPVQRVYFRSWRKNMRVAEKYALDNKWEEAAEYWEKEAESKNHGIAAEACFNVAFTCEMKGNPEEALQWLDKSATLIKKKDPEFKFYYKQYRNNLVRRKKEIVRVAKQMRSTK